MREDKSQPGDKGVYSRSFPAMRMLTSRVDGEGQERSKRMLKAETSAGRVANKRMLKAKLKAETLRRVERR